VTRDRRLMIVLGLDVALVAALVLVGVRAHSLAVLAEGADYVADAAAAALSLLALWLTRRPPTTRHPQGFPRAASYAAFFNAAWLLLVSIGVVVVATHRLIVGSVAIVALPVLIVSAVAAALMGVAAFVLGGDDDDESGESLAVRAVLLDTIADVASAAGVAVVGAVILVAHGWYWLDPAIALVIAAVVGWHAIALLRKVVASLRS